MEYAEQAIAASIAFKKGDEHPYFPIVNKGYALLFQGTEESRELAVKILSESISTSKRLTEKTRSP